MKFDYVYHPGLWENDGYAPSTLKVYESHWTRFVSHHKTGDQGALTVLNGKVVVNYLSLLREVGSSLSNMRGVVAALGYVAVEHGLENVSKDPAVKNYLKAVARNDVTMVRKAAPFTLEMIRNVELPNDDADLLEVGLRLGLRRSELVAIRWGDRSFGLPNDPNKAIVIPKAKQGTRRVPIGEAIVRIFERRLIDASSEWVFPARRGDGHVSENTVNRLVKKVAQENGYDPADYSGHSLRSGFVTMAFDKGYSVADIAAVTGHKTYDQVLSYARSVGVDLDI